MPPMFQPGLSSRCPTTNSTTRNYQNDYLSILLIGVVWTPQQEGCTSDRPGEPQGGPIRDQSIATGLTGVPLRTRAAA